MLICFLYAVPLHLLLTCPNYGREAIIEHGTYTCMYLHLPYVCSYTCIYMKWLSE